MDDPELKDTDEYFAPVKFKKDYNNDIHAIRHIDDHRVLTLTWKGIKKRIKDQVEEMVTSHNYEQILFIDWLNTANQAKIRQDTLNAKIDSIGEFYTFTLKLEILP